MKTAVIFGGSKGIGAEIAREFARNNYFVVISYNKSKSSAENVLQDVKNNGGDGIIIKADISNYFEVNALVDKVVLLRKTIDVAIMNAGISKTSLLIDSSIEDIQELVNTNLLGTIYCCKAIAAIMCSQHSGKIINIASMWGEVGASCESVYSATKGGIIALTKSLAKELGYNGINVNAISPGLINTDMNAHLSKQDISDIIDMTPSSRIGNPSDIAKAAIWLASDDASYINGQVISINGGFII